MRSLVALLRREMLAPEPSTPGGRPLVGEALAHELGYRQGWRDRTERLIAWLAAAIVAERREVGALKDEVPSTVVGG